MRQTIESSPFLYSDMPFREVLYFIFIKWEIWARNGKYLDIWNVSWQFNKRKSLSTQGGDWNIEKFDGDAIKTVTRRNWAVMDLLSPIKLSESISFKFCN